MPLRDAAAPLRVVSAVESPAMTKSCARDLTDRIKAGVNDVAEMLHRAHEGRAWEALGYASWKDYCTAEFQMSKRRSYQLLDFVEIKQEVSAIDVECTTVHSPISERQTRPLKSLPRGKRAEAWRRAEEIAGGEQPTAMQVKQAVVETKATPEDDGEIEDDDEPQHWAAADLHPPSEGLALAEQAIAILKKIRRNDKQRWEAFEQVRHWLWDVQEEEE